MLTNHFNTYRYPLYLITDDTYGALGAIALEGDRYIGRDTSGKVLFDRQDYDGMTRAGRKHGRIVSAAFYGVKTLGEYRPETNTMPCPCLMCDYAARHKR
jgi:hypothetical protein